MLFEHGRLSFTVDDIDSLVNTIQSAIDNAENDRDYRKSRSILKKNAINLCFYKMLSLDNRERIAETMSAILTRQFSTTMTNAMKSVAMELLSQMR